MSSLGSLQPGLHRRLILLEKVVVYNLKGEAQENLVFLNISNCHLPIECFLERLVVYTAIKLNLI